MALIHDILDSDSNGATVRFINELGEVYARRVYGDPNSSEFSQLIESHKSIIEERAANGIIKFSSP